MRPAETFSSIGHAELEVEAGWDADDDVAIGLDGCETYLSRDELRRLRDHLNGLLDVPARGREQKR